MTEGLTAGSLLELWERAGTLGPVDRALALAGAAGADPVALLDRPLGETHLVLLDLCESLLGPELAATATCPACAERVEFALDTGSLRSLAPVPEAGADEAYAAARPPTPTDLLATIDAPDPVVALAGRCVNDVDLAVAEAVMTAADPLAEVLVELTCPECGAEFEADVDVGAFVWAEVDAVTRRLLHEVDLLARAYGWTEPDVLALSQARRAAYLRLVLEGAP
jgi:hypothetical protein